MNSHVTRGFRELLASLPVAIRRRARAAYRQFGQNPRHPSLLFKQIHGSEHLVSVRISRGYRAVGVSEAPDEIIWFWVGPHEEYEKLLRQG